MELNATDTNTTVADSWDGAASSLVSAMLWLPHASIGIFLVILVMASFVRFHCKHGHRYRKSPGPRLAWSDLGARDVSAIILQPVNHQVPDGPLLTVLGTDLVGVSEQRTFMSTIMSTPSREVKWQLNGGTAVYCAAANRAGIDFGGPTFTTQIKPVKLGTGFSSLNTIREDSSFSNRVQTNNTKDVFSSLQSGEQFEYNVKNVFANNTHFPTCTDISSSNHHQSYGAVADTLQSGTVAVQESVHMADPCSISPSIDQNQVHDISTAITAAFEVNCDRELLIEKT